jgi:outer membrane receptor protein involved in Fe transport
MDAAQSVQFLSGEELWNVGFTKLDDVVQLVPGVSLPSGTASIRTYNIRGTGAMTTNDSPVGFYIDQMPYYIVDYPYAPDSELFDLESVQVLRGPQGTLYGQGAMGGTMLITTKRPDLEQVRARVRAGASTMRDGGDGHMTDASLSFPLIPGEMAMSITGGTSRDPGLAEGFDVPGSDLDKDDRWYGRVKLYWEASDLVNVTAIYHHRDVESSGSRGTYLSADPALLSPSGGSLGGTDFEVDMFGITVDWDTSIGTLTSSTSYLD